MLAKFWTWLKSLFRHNANLPAVVAADAKAAEVAVVAGAVEVAKAVATAKP